MAANGENRQVKRRRGAPRQSGSKTPIDRIFIIGVGVLTVALIGYGMAQIFGLGSSASAEAIAVDTSQLESVSLEDGQRQPAAEAPVAAADRESRYLGAPTDPAAVSLAEAGQLGQPALIWFHADWCHVCQQIKPQVVDLGEKYDGQARIVRLNVDMSESREALRRYGVRATPTFVLIDAKGQVRGNVPGWPGFQAFTTAFEQLLAGG